MESFVYLHAYSAYQSSSDRAIAPEILELFESEWFSGKRLKAHFRVSFLAIAAIAAILGTAGDALAQGLLQRESRGEDVRTLQELLQREGYFNTTPTGYFGSITEGAVKRFQRDRGLSADGKVGPRTWDALYGLYGGTQDLGFFPGLPPSTLPTPTFEMSPPPPPPNGVSQVAFNSDTTGRPVLQMGDRGTDVSRLQQELATRGFYFDTIDGIYGLNTRRAVSDFQRSQGLLADGIAGSRTLSALGLFNDEKRYVVVVPGDNEKLFEVRRYVGNASLADDRRGSYVNAGTFGSRAAAESRSANLRTKGLDARVAYF